MDIRIEDISFSYQKKPVLQKVSCLFKKAGLHAIIGPNGSGKTTLLDIISGFFKPQTGYVFLGKKAVHTISKRMLAGHIALVSQTYDINFPYSVKDIVLMGRHPYISRFSYPSRHDLSKVDEVMEITGITHLKNRPVTEVSGGEKQRCVFARALCQDTPILLLDEAFANMDINHTLHLLNILKDLTRKNNKTIVTVLHDLNMAAEWADTLLFIKNGRACNQGDVDSVFTESNLKDVFNVNAKVVVNEFTQTKQAFFKI